MRRIAFLLLLAVGASALALSPQEGWDLVAAVESGNQEAYARLVEAYQAGDPEAGAALGVLYLNGVAYPRDLERARRYFEWAQAKGSGWGSWGLAILYANGIGVAQDDQKGFRYARESMERGYPGGKALYAMFLIGGGAGLKQDINEGVKLIQEAAATGDPVALNVAARYLASSDLPGLSRDPKKAREYWERAAARGYFLARGFLAYDFFFGIGGPPDQKRALELARPLVGFEPAATAVWATALYFGQGGLVQNRPEACRLAKDQAKLQAGVATIYGLCILEGVAPGERALGLAYLALAAAWKHPPAQSLLSDWQKRLTPEEVNRAKELLKNLP
ncbi:tetratricopeptide repeat protein [Thermus brockianus]|uniref:tetratricopeptide repeat protein n=1 Tax=Thermus brockianus TaxID=56956 RepID=UPI001F2627A0|nr:tetratricopeptide repeat protein [Thermus brockianus]